VAAIDAEALGWCTMTTDFNYAVTMTTSHLKRGHDNNSVMRIWNRF
jgi:hypothetical protein